MRTRICTIAGVIVAVLAGCTSINPSNKASVSYNNAFARARDEVTVLNILRASQNQPLQFSTISNVTGSLKYGAKVSIPFTNVIAGGQDAISPSFEFANRNPAITIVPLSTEKFVQGISKRLEPGMPYELVTQGWPRDVVLRLAVGGVVCNSEKNGRRLFLNTGQDAALDASFASVLAGVEDFSVAKGEEPFATLTMSHKDALTFVKDGVGEGRRIDSVRILAGNDNLAEVKVMKLTVSQISGIDVPKLCGQMLDKNEATSFISLGASDEDTSEIILRSVQGMYLYLGNIHRRTVQNGAACARADDGSGSD